MSASESRASSLAEKNEQLGITIDPDTAASLWRGETMDSGLAIEYMLHIRDAVGES